MMRARHVIILWYMFYMLSINALCYDVILYCMGSIMGTIAMGTIGIILYQHFVTARTSYVIGIKHNKCLFWNDIIHVLMYSLSSYEILFLWFMLYMLSIYAQCYDAILYCMGTVDMRPIICGPLIWGPSIYDHPGDHRYVIHLDGFKLLVAGQRCHNVDSLIRDTASHSNHWVVRRATVALNDPTTTGW